MAIEDRKSVSLDELSAELGGLRPRAWACIGSGFSREDFKAELLARQTGFVGEAVLSPQSLCERIVGAVAGREQVAADRLLGRSSRQEILRVLLSKGGSAEYPELFRLKRQSTFFRKLDRAIQSGRLVAAHQSEREVMDERLKDRFGESPVRAELEKLAYVYESWIARQGLWDPPLLMKTAALALGEGWPEGLGRPERIYLFSAQHLESLEAEFWEAVASHVPVVRVGLPGRSDGAGSNGAASGTHAPALNWERWHTLDDAAEGLAQRLAEMGADSGGPSGYSRHVILIPDLPAMRRTVRRALDQWGVPMADPRDPTRLRWEEAIKAALLPMEVISRDFPRAKVITYLQSLRASVKPADAAEAVREICSRGIRRGLSSYSGGRLSACHMLLSELERRLGGRKDALQMSAAHLEYLAETLVGGHGMPEEEAAWVVSFFEAQWSSLTRDLQRLGKAARRAPTLFWLERLQARVSEATPPVERFKPADGVRVHRLQQAPVEACLVTSQPKRDEVVWLLGVPPQWLAGDGLGDYWYSERERETLASEFAVRSGARIREERKSALEARFRGATELNILDAHYDWDGKERESLVPFLMEAGLASPDSDFENLAVEMGSHLRWRFSYGAERPLQPQSFTLAPLGEGGQARVTSTLLDKYSACAFQGLGSGRWKLYDLRDPEIELWPDVRGRILHKAVELLLRSREETEFTVSVADALEQAWREEQPRGLIQGGRAAAMMKRRLAGVLESFCEKEKEYLERAGTNVLSLEQDTAFEMTFSELPGLIVRGQADRIDEHDDGLFIIDYKTGSSQPAGRDMIGEGYRLQLPFYALAAREKFGREVLGVQFVELNRKAGRSRGIFLKKYNGKNPGSLTKTTARSSSLIDASADEVWDQCRAQIVRHLEGMAGGRFEARPKKEIECRGCSYGDLCGRRRVVADAEAGDGGGTAAGAEDA